MKGRVKAGTGGHVSIRAIAAIVGIAFIGVGVLSLMEKWGPLDTNSATVTSLGRMVLGYADGSTQTYSSPAEILPWTIATIRWGSSPTTGAALSWIEFWSGLKITTSPSTWNPTVVFSWSKSIYLDANQKIAPWSGSGSITTISGTKFVYFNITRIQASTLETWFTATGTGTVKSVVSVTSIGTTDPNGKTITAPDVNCNDQITISCDKTAYSLTPTGLATNAYSAIMGKYFFATMIGSIEPSMLLFNIPIEYILIGLGIAILILGLWKGKGVAF